MVNLFNTFLYTPLFNFLVFLYNTFAFQDFGLAIILTTLFIRLILAPLSIKSLRSQKALQELQPKIKEVQEKYQNDRQGQSQAIMNLYKEHKVNPLSGCLPILIQLPILIALYKVSISGLEVNSLESLYSFINRPGEINKISLGFIDLTKRNLVLVFLAGIFQFIQSKLSLKSSLKTQNNYPEFQNLMNKQILYFFPVLTIIIAWNFPAGLPLYWVATTVFSISEQIFINRNVRKFSQESNHRNY